MMIHDLDMARWLLGEEPISVYARQRTRRPEDRRGGRHRYRRRDPRDRRRKLCQITNSRRCSYGYDQRIEVFGSAGLVRADNVASTTVETADGAGFTREPALPFFLERYGAAYRHELDEFLNALRGEPAQLATGRDGRQALVLANAAQRSLETGQPVAVAPP